MEDDKKEKYDEYDCKNYAECLMRAEEIKSNPAKMKAAHKYLSKAKKQISSIGELKEKIKSDMKDDAESDGY